jgi:hypothetical protein
MGRYKGKILMTPYAIARRARDEAAHFLFGSRLLSTLSSAQKDFLPSLSYPLRTSEIKVRGLLCSECNRGIGYFKDQVAIVRAAHLYLLSHQNNAAQSGNLNAEGNPAWIVTEGKTVKKGAA